MGSHARSRHANCSRARFAETVAWWAKNRPYVGRRHVIRPDWIGLALPTLRCACGSAVIVAAAPGAEPERALDLFAVGVGAPMRAWCWNCWPSRHSTETCADAAPAL